MTKDITILRWPAILSQNGNNPNFVSLFILVKFLLALNTISNNFAFEDKKLNKYMPLKKQLVLFLFSLFFSQSFAQNSVDDQRILNSNDSAVYSQVEYLKYFFSGNEWIVTNPRLGNDVNGLINFIIDQPIDSILRRLRSLPIDPSKNLVVRLPENVSDSLSIKGYVSKQMKQKRHEQIKKEVLDSYANKELIIPSETYEKLNDSLLLIPPGQGMRLFNGSVYALPDSLRELDVISDDRIQNASDFQRIIKMDSIRAKYVESKRIFYNDSIRRANRDSILLTYRKDLIQNDINLRVKKLNDSIAFNNYMVLKAYNDYEIKTVNDSIAGILSFLSDYANSIDTSIINLSSIGRKQSQITLANNNQMYTRIWLKNEQNDSISVLVRNIDKNSLSMLIDDGVTFERFAQQENIKHDFNTLDPADKLERVQSKYKIETPWNMGGNGDLGFTQTYQENWKKGGKSAISMLMVLKGFANYSDKKLKWENSGEIRNGWIKLGNQDGSDNRIQKNDDKFELTSRFGVSAFKKWYYSAELNIQSQFFNGYKYPDRENPISSFLAPVKTLFKIGLDYKPNKDLSIFISPLTSKTVYVRDTVNIDQTNFGIEEGKKRFWEPGLNADVKFKYEIDKNMTYETKYKMFVNYTNPFSKFDIDWENQLKIQFTDHINMQFMFHMLYDDNVLFTKYDDNGDELKNPDGSTQKETRIQLKELITVGFTYKINKKVFRSRRI